MRLRGKRSRERSADHLVHSRFGRPDERVVYVARGTGAASGQSYQLIATDVALYVYDTRERRARRYAYDELVRVDIGEDRTFPRYAGYIEFTDRRTGTLFGFDDLSLTKGALARFVKEAAERSASG
jgi:hypothetical protein